MYKKYQNYNDWKSSNVSDKGRKFFFCFIEDNYRFEYWSFEPKDLQKH